MEGSNRNRSAKQRHSLMVYELSQYIAPGPDGTNYKWKGFMEMLPLTPAEKARSKDVFDIFNILLEQNEIQYGSYTVVKDVLRKMKLLDCLRIVEEYEDKRIKTIHQQTGTVKADISVGEFTPTSADKGNIYKTIMNNYNEGLLKIRDLPHEEYLTKSKELHDIYEKSLKLVNDMVEKLEKYDISPKQAELGSLVIGFECHSMESLLVLWKMYTNGELLQILQSGLVTDYVLKECDAESIQLNVYISPYAFAHHIKGTHTGISDAAITGKTEGTTANVAKVEDESDLYLAVRPPEMEPKLVAAIDFGNTYSGFACSFTHEYERIPTKIYVHKWLTAGGGIGMPSFKTPTTLLLKPNKEFGAFGFEAEDAYASLLEEDDHLDWYYFKWFKTLLHNPQVKLTRETMLKAENGRQVLALTVFSESIGYMRRTLLDSFKSRETQIKEENITWVLAVPASWGEDAKHFMRFAAENVGIKGDALILALEPDAATIYSKEVNAEKTQTAEDNKEEAYISEYDIGTNFMVVDIGGTTADITISEVMHDRTLKHIACESTGVIGGVKINAEFWKFIEAFVPAGNKEEFASYHTEVLDLQREIERQIRDLNLDESGRICLKLGSLGKLMDMTSAESSYTENVSFRRNKLYIPAEKIIKFFEPSVKNITDHVKDIFKKVQSKCITDAIVVGGLSECEIISAVVQSVLKGCRVVRPVNADLAVLKGCVLYGHNTAMISTRSCTHTYGISSYRLFLESDDKSKMVMIDGVPYCKDVFYTLLEKDKMYCIGQRAHTDVHLVKSNLTKICVRLYRSTAKNPKYITDEGCSYIDKMMVDMPKQSGRMEEKVSVNLVLGQSEMIYEVWNKQQELRIKD